MPGTKREQVQKLKILKSLTRTGYLPPVISRRLPIKDNLLRKKDKTTKYFILTEEKPSIPEIRCILTRLDIQLPDNIIIKPTTLDYNTYSIDKIENIRIVVIEGKSSMVDYVVYKTDVFDNSIIDTLYLTTPILILESTKTKPSDSGNSGQYQRIGKFTYFFTQYPTDFDTIIKIMFYDNLLEEYSPAFANSIRIQRSLGIIIVNKNGILPWHYDIIRKLYNIEELVKLYPVEQTRKSTNVPLTISIDRKTKIIRVNAKLGKPDAQKRMKFTNDPNIGFTEAISLLIRKYLDVNDYHILFTSHFIDQYTLNTCNNKWFRTMDILGNYSFDKLENSSSCDTKIKVLPYFSTVSKTKEKSASINMDVRLRLLKDRRYFVIFSNHAGTEKTDIKSTVNNNSIPTKKKANYLYPDLVFVDTIKNILYVVEGKTFATREKGINELSGMDEFIEDTKNFIEMNDNIKIKEIKKVLCLMASDKSFNEIQTFSKQSKYPVIFSINKDNNFTIDL